MLYLGIDQHAKQITVCVRNEEGDTVLRRQVSTRPEKIEAFFEQFTQMDAEFMAILEVCGFNDWLIRAEQHFHEELGITEVFKAHAGRYARSWPAWMPVLKKMPSCSIRSMRSTAPKKVSFL
mgnify:CR=1 FL=1